MADDRKRVKIWYDPEGDSLDVIFDQKPGYFRETESDQVMEKVDEEGSVLGFSILRVSAMKAKPLDVALRAPSWRTEPLAYITSDRTLFRARSLRTLRHVRNRIYRYGDVEPSVDTRVTLKLGSLPRARRQTRCS